MVKRKVTAAQAELLGHYVYVYYDTESGDPFYIGKGQGNRIFDHPTGSHNVQVRERLSGGNYKADFLVYGLDEKSALKVEAAAIDLIGTDNLANRKRGDGARTYGRVDADTLLRSIEELPLVEVPDNLMVVPIRETYERYGDDPQALYESTRGVWPRPQNDIAEGVQYVAGAVDGRIVYVMAVAAMLQAGSTNYFIRSDRDLSDLVEFVGKTAAPDVQDRYLGRRIKSNIQNRWYAGPYVNRTHLFRGEWEPEYSGWAPSET